MLFGASDNGIASSHSNLTMADVRLYAGAIKRPDVSYRIRPRALPNPSPNLDDIPCEWGVVPERGGRSCRQSRVT